SPTTSPTHCGNSPCGPSPAPSTSPAPAPPPGTASPPKPSPSPAPTPPACAPAPPPNSPAPHPGPPGPSSTGTTGATPVSPRCRGGGTPCGGHCSRVGRVNEGRDTKQLPLGVVTVTYSPGEHLRALVDSLPGATPDGTVLVMADNGSVDGSPEAEAERATAEGRDDVIFLPTGGNIGYGAAANRGIAELARMRDAGRIRGDYVLLANPD